MFHVIAGISIAISAAAADAEKWGITRDGVEVRRQGEVVRVALPGWQWAGPPYGRMLALGTGPRGEVLVTSDVVPTVWRIDRRSLAVTVHPLALDADRDKDVGFTALVYSRGQGVYFGRGALDGICWRIDARLTEARKGTCMQE
jgi:hypothetical protein